MTYLMDQTRRVADARISFPVRALHNGQRPVSMLGACLGDARAMLGWDARLGSDVHEHAWPMLLSIAQPDASRARRTDGRNEHTKTPHPTRETGCNLVNARARIRRYWSLGFGLRRLRRPLDVVRSA